MQMPQVRKLKWNTCKCSDLKPPSQIQLLSADLFMLADWLTGQNHLTFRLFYLTFSTYGASTPGSYSCESCPYCLHRTTFQRPSLVPGQPARFARKSAIDAHSSVLFHCASLSLLCPVAFVEFILNSVYSVVIIRVLIVIR